MITAFTEIAAPPHVVRELMSFLDFPNLHKWHTSNWILNIECLAPGKKAGLDMVAGDKMRSTITGMHFTQTIQENTPTRVKWVGPWYGLFTGTHAFFFEQSKEHPESPEHCLLTQWEDFTGVLSWPMKNPNRFGGKRTMKGFLADNGDLKAYAEKVWSERRVEGETAALL